MKEIFENEYKMDRELFNEYVYNVLCKKMIVSGLIISLIGILFFCLVTSKISYVILTAVIITIISIIIGPIILSKELEENSKRLNNGNIEKTNIKFSNNIIMNEGNVHLEFEYSQINKILQTKNFIVLKIGKQSSILVLKNGFLKGTEKEFIKFIKEKTNIK